MLHNRLSYVVANLHTFCYLIFFYLIMCTICFIKTFQEKQNICPNAFL